MKILSLFDGISCGMVALERANIEIERYVSYEIDKNAIAISQNNYPGIERMGDVFMANFEIYEGFDLLIGGSPCTFWSIARTSGDRETTSSGFGWELFSQYVRALKESKCKYFLYENNLSMSSEIKKEITKSLGVKPLMIDSSTFTAQRRERLYWTNIPVSTEVKDKCLKIKDILEVAGCFEYVPEEKLNNKRFLKSYLQYDINGKGNASQDQRAFYLTSKCGTLDTGCAHKPKILLPDGRVRKFTQTELERLQTLPDGYTRSATRSIAGKGIGNGWTVDVIAHILKSLQ